MALSEVGAAIEGEQRRLYCPNNPAFICKLSPMFTSPFCSSRSRRFTSMALIPARRAVSRPCSLSSNTTHRRGPIPNKAAACRNRSGAGFGLATSSIVTMWSKYSHRPVAC